MTTRTLRGTARPCPRARRRSRRCGRCSTRSPRYDLVNRIMTFRLDVRWRRSRRFATWPGPSGSIVLDLASGTGDLCIDLRERRASTPISMDLSFGMLAADRSGAPRAQADILRLPVPDRRRRRCHVRVRAPEPDRARRVLRRAGAGRPSGRADRAARRRRPDEPRSSGSATTSTSARSSPRSAPCSPTVPAYRYLPKSVAYLPEPDEMVAMLRRAGFADASHRPAVGRPHPAAARHPRLTSTAMRAVTVPLDTVADGPVDLNDVARGDGYLFVRDGVGFAGRGVAAPGSPWTTR